VRKIHNGEIYDLHPPVNIITAFCWKLILCVGKDRNTFEVIVLKRATDGATCEGAELTRDDDLKKI